MHSGTALDHRGRLSLVTSHTSVGFPRSTKPSSHEKWQTLPKVRLEDEHCFDPCRDAPGSGHRSTAAKRLSHLRKRSSWNAVLTNALCERG